MREWAGRAYVFAYDIVGYARRAHHGQQQAVELTANARQAATAALSGATTVWCDAGDGGYLLIHSDVRAPLNALEAFAASVAAQNAVRLEEFRVALRYALDVGPVQISEGRDGERQVVGDAINNCARLLSGMPKENLGQVVVSGTYRDELVGFYPGDAANFTLLADIIDKHGGRHVVWNLWKPPHVGMAPQATGACLAGSSSAGEASMMNRAEDPNPLRLHREHVERLLADVAAKPFLDALISALNRKGLCDPLPSSASDVARHFAACHESMAEELMIAVRQGLWALREAGASTSAARGAAERAAAALYWLAACRLVNRQARREGEFLVSVPRVDISPDMILAIISTALFGGRIEVRISETGLPVPEGLFKVDLIPGGEQHGLANFERAAYKALFPDKEETDRIIALGDGQLEERYRLRLLERFKTIKRVRETALTLVVNMMPESDGVREFVHRHEIPVLGPATETTEVLLGLEPGQLEAGIQEFWGELEHVRYGRSHKPAPAEQASSIQTEPQPPSPLKVFAGDHATILVTTGDQSPAQTGSEHTADASRRNGIDTFELAAVLGELADLLAGSTALADREALAEEIGSARQEAAATEPDTSRIKSSIDRARAAMTGCSNTVMHAERIMKLLDKAEEMLRSLLS